MVSVGSQDLTEQSKPIVDAFADRERGSWDFLGGEISGHAGSLVSDHAPTLMASWSKTRSHPRRVQNARLKRKEVYAE